MTDAPLGKRARVALLIAVVVAGGAYVAWDYTRVERVDFAWVVRPEAPVVVAFERDSSSLRIADARTGESLGRLAVGSSRHGGSPRLFGPAGPFAWVSTDQDGIRLVDLTRGEVVATHQELCEAAGQTDLRVPHQGRVLDADGRLHVEGADGRSYALSTDRSAAPVPEAATLTVADAACADGLHALREASSLHDPRLRGCFELGGEPHGLVQHASAAFGDRFWKATLFDAAGSALWTLEAPELTGAGGWFGHAMPSGDAVWVVVVEPGRRAASVHAIELDAATGDLRSQNTVL